ncbi:MAG: GH92 family glycosyl hydrolase [Deltaproteobacteria bacterium]|nr:GH92 family glycosyl hydrolase [Deltaproteobacteria bacterium]
MRRQILICTALLVACSKQSPPPPAPTPTPTPVDPVTLVDTRLGSGGFAYGAGNCFPGAAVPNGMVNVGPDTTGKYGDLFFIHYDGYWDGDDTIQGFSHLHLSGTGASDFAVLSVMPLVGFDSTKLTVADNATKFDKSTEVAKPGDYEVTLANGIKAELSATAHVASHRYTFPAGTASPALLFDLTHAIRATVTTAEAHLDATKNRIQGSLTTTGGMSGGFTLYFAIQLDRAWTHATVWNTATPPASGADITGAGSSFALELDGTNTTPVQMAVGLSFVSATGALANLTTEQSTLNLDGVRRDASTLWHARLAMLTPTGGSDADTQLLYSALHHLFVMPSMTSDADGSYVYEGHTGQASGFNVLSSLSLWDTYRTANPLYDLLAPDRASDIVQSLDAMQKINGAFPKWPLATSDSGTMDGSSADVVITDAVLKNVPNLDAESLYQRLRAAALDTTPPAGGRGGRSTDFDDYNELGYVTADGGGDGSVSLTLEYAQEDFALSNLASWLSHSDDQAALLERSHGYRKLYDPDGGFLRARRADGSLAPEDFVPTAWVDYVEADAYQSLWGAPHDAAGTAQLLGGNDAAIAALQDFFTQAKTENDQIVAHLASDPTDVLTANMPRNHFWAGNEPDIHTPYLFALLGRPDLTQQWVAWVRSAFYNSTSSGLPGNDDGGTLSAWFVWSAMGFYPLAGSDSYIVGTPLFPKLVIQLPGGTFTVEANNVSATNIYVQSATLNGEPLLSPVFRHHDIQVGGVLHLEMGPTPSIWGR